MVEYVFHRNSFTDDPSAKIAHPVNVRVHTNDDMAAELFGGNIGISKPEARAAVEAFEDTILKWAGRGEAYNSLLFHIHFSIPGVYRGTETPDHVAVRITPSKQLTAAMSGQQLKKVEAPVALHIEEVRDAKSQSVGQHLTPGGNLTITGRNLKIVGAAEGIGLLLIPADAAQPSLSIPKEDLILNQPSRLIIVVPTACVSGMAYQLKLSTHYSGDNTVPLKTARSITYDKILTAL